MSSPPSLAVIGNVSIDTVRYPDGRRYDLLGGAALYVAMAVARAGLAATPVTVVGDDLGDLHTDPRLADLDLTRVRAVGGPSCSFEISYDSAGAVTALAAAYGAAESLTDHALGVLTDGKYDHWHVCCRRPLDTARILGRLVAAELPFSLDFHLASAGDQIAAAALALPYAAVVFVNAAEYQVLTTTLAEMLGPTAGRALQTAVVSDGPREVTLLCRGDVVARQEPASGSVVEVTGAGDTLAGTFLAHLAHGKPEPQALAHAVAAASAKTQEQGLRYRGR